MKKIVLLLALLLIVPSLANAWSVNSKCSPATGQGTISPAGNKSYATGQDSDEYRVLPLEGYKISRVTLDGVTISPNANGNYVAPYNRNSWRYIVAYFTSGTIDITRSATSGGVIREAQWAPLTKIPYGSSRTFRVVPNPGYIVSGLSATGTPTITTEADGSKTVSYTDLKASQSISATFSIVSIVTADAGPDVKTTGNGQEYRATLTGRGTSNQGAISYRWSGAPELVFGTPNAATTTVYSNTPGSYIATLTATSGGRSASDTVKVNIENKFAYQVQICAGCHSLNRSSLVPDYQASRHNGANSCQGCHTENGHANVLVDCSVCHSDPSRHPVAITTSCTGCHNPHSLKTSGVMPEALHYNNMTSAGYPASYVTSRSKCVDCHNSTANNLAVRLQWEASGHAATNAPAWASGDFKTLSGCVRCHTTTGFVTYAADRSSAAWGVASDKTKELLTCIGCHSDVSNGTVRSIGRIAPYAADPGYSHPEAGRSNICLPCHSGTDSGKSISARLSAAADFTNMGFISPHYLTAAGPLNAQGGYHFPGRSYSQGSTHAGIGMTGGSGPCISCHKSSTSGHRFRSGADNLCAGCHGAALTTAQLNDNSGAFLNALSVLRAQLAAKGFVYSESSRSFANTNWGAGEAGANTMGAAFNFVLLANEPGAFAHNPEYARQLIFDSIDFLDDGQFNDSVLSLAVPNLRDSQAITAESAAAVAPYKNRDRCTICHGGSAASTPPMASNAHAAHISRSYGPGSYLGNGVSACQSCHRYGTATHANGSVDLAAGSCAGCHPGTVPSWSLTTRLECTSCHAATPSVLPNGVAAPYKKEFLSTGHGRYGASNLCTDCHDPDSRHISGSLNDHTRVRISDNNLCASCHNSTTVRAEYRYMSTHMAAGIGSACLDCHDPHGTANTAMVRSSINGFAIAYTGGASLVNLTTNRGLCQVCHTKTAHYRAGVAESSHYSSGCLGCHNHNSEGGAFRPVGGSCDSCHGYPPAPKNQGGLFGTQSNWANARFEDYSGGGGAHLIAAHVSPFAVASDAWSNCTICHNAGRTGSAPYHKMTTPLRDRIADVTVEVDPSFRFAPGFTVYTGARLVSSPEVNATGSCFNISCHMSPSPRWSTDR